MKRWIAGLSTVLLLVFGPASSSAAPLVETGPQATTVKQDPKTITVYVTRTGTKYHRDG